MDDTACQRFFLEPSQPVHCRYAALRAFFVDGLSLPAIADRFGSTYHTIRSWVRDFRAHCQAGSVPPFLPSHTSAVRPAMVPRLLIPKRPPSPTPGS